jgi:hypothetical protein
MLAVSIFALALVLSQAAPQTSSALDLNKIPIAQTSHDKYPFDDLNGNIHQENFVWAFQHGVTKGSPEGSRTYKPQDLVNRGSMASFLRRIIGNPSISKGKKPNSFSDIGTNMHKSNIDWLSAEGITQGSPKGSHTYKPGDVVNRGSMSTFLHRLYDYLAKTKKCGAGKYNEGNGKCSTIPAGAKAKKRTLHLSANGGNGKMGDLTCMDYGNGCYVSVPEPSFSKDGYLFLSWRAKAGNKAITDISDSPDMLGVCIRASHVWNPCMPDSKSPNTWDYTRWGNDNKYWTTNENRSSSTYYTNSHFTGSGMLWERNSFGYCMSDGRFFSCDPHVSGSAHLVADTTLYAQWTRPASFPFDTTMADIGGRKGDTLERNGVANWNGHMVVGIGAEGFERYDLYALNKSTRQAFLWTIYDPNPVKIIRQNGSSNSFNVGAGYFDPPRVFGNAFVAEHAFENLPNGEYTAAVRACLKDYCAWYTPAIEADEIPLIIGSRGGAPSVPLPADLPFGHENVWLCKMLPGGAPCTRNPNDVPLL